MSSLLSDDERRQLTATAVEAARAAGAVLLERAGAGFHIEHKDAINLVTDADRQAEQMIVQSIRRHYPTHRILAEESGLHDREASPFTWVVDPLDGTTNFAHGYPVYCVSIGIEYQGRLIAGVVFDPTRDELFVGEAGRGATLNGKALHVSRTGDLGSALVVTGFAYDIRQCSQNNLDYFSRFALKARGVRRTGAAALDLCYVAAGRFDGFWEMKLHPWDMAAGAVIVVEAGGKMSDFAGGAFSIYGRELVASNGAIHPAMLAVLQDGACD